MTTENAKDIMAEHGCPVVDETPLDHGVQLRGNGGQIVNVFHTGAFSVQGKNNEGLEEKFRAASSTGIQRPSLTAAPPTDVFIVYGQNEEIKREVESILRRWELNPIMLDQIPAEGLTLIEKLEKYIRAAPFAVVLATADDVYLSDPDDDTQKEFRARQNVVLELGMMLAHLHRENVAILLEDRVGMKKPSDIDGLEYLPFKDHAAEVGVNLAKMMTNRGYAIDIGNL